MLISISVEVTNGNTLFRIGVKTVAGILLVLASYIATGAWWAATIYSKVTNLETLVQDIRYNSLEGKRRDAELQAIKERITHLEHDLEGEK